MISALFFINQKGEVVISRMYRDGVTRSVAETFRTHVIGNKDERSPIKVVGDTVFMYVKHGNMFVVAVASGNAQAAMTFQFLHSVVTVLKSYFGAFDEDSIRNNFVLIYELLDEVLDYGYPQNCTTDVLKMYITQEGNKSASLAQKDMASSVTIQATGAISWRKEGIKYRKNELFIDVVEHCNLMMSSKGTILRNDVSGVILVKCYLSGTPGAPPLTQPPPPPPPHPHTHTHTQPALWTTASSGKSPLLFLRRGRVWQLNSSFCQNAAAQAVSSCGIAMGEGACERRLATPGALALHAVHPALRGPLSPAVCGVSRRCGLRPRVPLP